jgi:hypothetical protein
MKKRINPKAEAMKKRSLIVENERQAFHTPDFYLVEQVVTDHDATYDYRKDGDEYFFRKKGETQWKKASGEALNSIKTMVFGDKPSTTQPTAKSTEKKDSGFKYVDPMIAAREKLKGDSDTFSNVGGQRGKEELEKIATSVTSEKKIPFTNKEEGDKFRNWVNDNYPDYAKTLYGDGLSRSGAYDNKYMRAAWEKFADKYLSGDNQSASTPKNTGNYVIPVAWPEYEPEITDGSEWSKQIQSVLGQAIFGHDSEKYDSTDKTTGGKAGHGGIGIVESDGRVRLFEFGRYTGHGKGMGLTKVANIPVRAKFNKNNELINADEIAKSMKQNSQGEGPKLEMKGYVVPIPNIEGALKMANVKGNRPYQLLDIDATDNDFNCGSFAVSVAKAGGLPLGNYCFPNPNASLNSFKEHAIATIQA